MCKQLIVIEAMCKCVDLKCVLKLMSAIVGSFEIIWTSDVGIGVARTFDFFGGGEGEAEKIMGALKLA